MSFMEGCGPVRSGVRVVQSGPEMHFLDEKGTVRAKVFMDGETVGLVLRDGAGEVGAVVYVGGDSPARLQLHKPGDSRPRVVYSVGADGRPEVEYYNDA